MGASGHYGILPRPRCAVAYCDGSVCTTPLDPIQRRLELLELLARLARGA